MKPLKRGPVVRKDRQGGEGEGWSMIRNRDWRTEGKAGSGQPVRGRRLRAPEPGRNPGRQGPPRGFGRVGTPGRIANRKRGCRVERQRRFLPGQALKGETPRARRVETYPGDHRGSKASKSAGTAGTQHDPERQSPGVVARGGWVALGGRKTSRERELRREPGVQETGSYSEAGTEA